MTQISTIRQVLASRWSGLSLARQFALASFIILSTGMVSMAAWVSSRIENGVVSNSALSAALFMDSFIAPLLQELNSGNTLSLEHQRELSQLIEQTPLGEQVEAFKIWGTGGVVVHSSNRALIGREFPVTQTQKLAWQGTIQAEYDNLRDEEDVSERRLAIPLLEIYSPIRNNAGRIIAVSEFYANATQLQRDLFYASLHSWLLFGAAGLVMFAALSSIAISGSRTIKQQQGALKNRVTELVELRQRLEKASRRSTELNESFLRKVGADLHDGPAQLLALALLKLEELFRKQDPEIRNQQVALCIKEPLQDALTEIRGLSAGLVLPGLEGKSLQEVLHKAVSSHRRRTGANVTVEIEDNPELPPVPHSVLICLYRFAQETLNNAFHHGKCAVSHVRAHFDEGILSVVTEDCGCGFDCARIEFTGEGLGLPGLRERIESVGGRFRIQSSPGSGTRVQASFELPFD